MIFFAVVALCLGAFMVLCWLLWEDITRVVSSMRKHDDRISKLEVNDYNQDVRLDAHRKHLIKVKKDIRELGHDVGWDDSGRSTQVMESTQISDLVSRTKKPDDEPPDDAA